MRSSRRAPMVALLFGLAMVAAVASMLTARDASGTPEVRDSVAGEYWPPFEAVVVSEIGPPGRTWRKVEALDHRGRLDWTKEILEDSGSPLVVGLVRTYRGGELIVSRPNFPDQVTKPEEGQIPGPGRWLALWETVPEFDVVDEGDVVRLTQTVVTDCTVADCAPGSPSRYEYSRVVVLHEASRIPLLVEERNNGVVEERYELVEFRLK